MRQGDTIAQRFVLEEQAGAGAMGFVFRARDLQTGGAVAVKVLRVAGLESLARFEREAIVLSRVQAPEIARYVAHGISETKEPFLAMEWIVGESLRSRLERGPLTFREIVHVGAAVARALVVMHEKGVVHRDLKPANIMLAHAAAGDSAVTRATVKVVDFGVARIRVPGESITETGDMVGTLEYMSPEQARGTKDIDGRADLFSLGVILFRSIAGFAPFESDDGMSTLLKLATEEAPPAAKVAPGTPPRLAKLVDSMLQTEVSSRPRDAAAVLAELERIDAELGKAGNSIPVGVASSPASYERTVGKKSWRRPALVGGLVLAACAAAGTLGFVYTTRKKPVAAPTASVSSAPAGAVAASPPRSVPTIAPPASSPPPKLASLDGWTHYKDPGGAFEVKLECAKPGYKHVPPYDDLGARFERSVSGCDSRKGFMAISVSDVLSGATMGCGLANRMSEDKVMEAVGCTVDLRTQVTMGDFEGDNVGVTCPKQKMRGEMRFLCDPKLVESGKGRGFVVQFLRLAPDWDPNEAALFWSTLKLYTMK